MPVDHTDTHLDGDRYADHRAHRRDALGHNRRLLHQTGAERSNADLVAGTTAVEVDLAVAEVRADARCGSQLPGIAAAQLQG